MALGRTSWWRRTSSSRPKSARPPTWLRTSGRSPESRRPKTSPARTTSSCAPRRRTWTSWAGWSRRTSRPCPGLPGRSPAPWCTSEQVGGERRGARAEAERGGGAQVGRGVHVPAQSRYVGQLEFGGAAGRVPRPGREPEGGPERGARRRRVQRGAIAGRVGYEGVRPGGGGFQGLGELGWAQGGQVGRQRGRAGSGPVLGGERGAVP